jgi:hypothetical protein
MPELAYAKRKIVIAFPATAAITVSTGSSPKRIPAGTTAMASNHGIAPAMKMPSRPKLSRFTRALLLEFLQGVVDLLESW